MNTYLKKFIEKKFDKPGTALDLGAGQFFDVACLKQLGWECEGVDIKMGIDLEKPYKSKNAPFDLVYSNYLLHKLENKEQFLQTIYNNLKKDGWCFIHSFDISDKSGKSKLSEDYMKKLLNQYDFKNNEVKVFSYYDNEEGHEHWHRILEVSGQK